jgi:hypothetical protein
VITMLDRILDQLSLAAQLPSSNGSRLLSLAAAATLLLVSQSPSMSVNSMSNRTSSVAQEDLKMKPPLAGKFDGLPPPRGDETMVDVCSRIIADARVGLNGINAAELVTTCHMCDNHGRDVKQFQEKMSGAVPSDLPVSSVASLALYTAELSSGESPYSACNGALRSANRSKCDPFVPFIWQLMHALAKCEPYVGGNVYRGVKADLRAQYPKDREVTWFQFSSCTCDIQVQQSEQFLGKTGTRTLFSIELTTGRARTITKFSLVPSEAEVLLPPNSRLKVVSQFDAGNGLTIIQLKELPSLDPIIDFDALPSSPAPAPTPAPRVVVKQKTGPGEDASNPQISHAKSSQLLIVACHFIRQRMPRAFKLAVLVVLCAAAYMQFVQLTFESHRVQSIIDEKVREAGGLEKVGDLNLVSASVEPGNHLFRTKHQRVL